MSNVDYVVEELKDGPKSFKDIVNALTSQNKVCLDDIGYLFSDMNLDSRLISLEDNFWDLKNRHVFKEKRLSVEILDDTEADIYEGEEEEIPEVDEDGEEIYIQSIKDVGIYEKDEQDDEAE